MALVSIIFIFMLDYIKNKFKDRRGLRWLPYVPDMLIAVLIGIGVTAIWELDKQGLQVLGKYDTMFPGIQLLHLIQQFTHRLVPKLPPLTDLTLVRELVEIAIVITVVG